jgi:hypothetical protein
MLRKLMAVASDCMSSELHASILGWSFAPVDALQEGLVPPEWQPLSPEGMVLDFVPPALRRRCSHFSKVSLAVANAAMRRAPEGCPPHTVFASIHGEGAITRDLLRELALGQQLSPMGFSLSVHNAASGLYSIATGNTAPSTAIAAGDDTFVMGLLEALMALRCNSAANVLLVCSDDLVPRDFLAEGSSQGVPYAFSLLLGSATPAGSVVLSLDRGCGEGAHGVEEEHFPQAVKVARWMHSDGCSLSLRSGGACARLTLSGSGAQNLFVSAYR